MREQAEVLVEARRETALAESDAAAWSTGRGVAGVLSDPARAHLIAGAGSRVEDDDLMPRAGASRPIVAPDRGLDTSWCYLWQARRRPTCSTSNIKATEAALPS